jgi:hypothetical protein
MYGFILIAIMLLASVAFATLICSLFDESGASLCISVISIAVCIVLMILVAFASTKCEKQPWHRDDPYITHTVIALQDGNEINGRIRGSRYCMSGYINEKFTYVYGYKTAGGGMKIQKAGEDTTTVYFRDDIEPCAKWYEETRKFWFVEETRYTCDIFVPTDSLDARITIDLQ